MSNKMSCHNWAFCRTTLWTNFADFLKMQCRSRYAMSVYGFRTVDLEIRNTLGPVTRLVNAFYFNYQIFNNSIKALSGAASRVLITWMALLLLPLKINAKTHALFSPYAMLSHVIVEHQVNLSSSFHWPSHFVHLPACATDQQATPSLARFVPPSSPPSAAQESIYPCHPYPAPRHRHLHRW